MANFDDLIEAQLSGATVRSAALARFDFRSRPAYLWRGFGSVLIAGNLYQGMGDLGSLSPVVSGTGLAVEEMEFKLFGSTANLEHFSEDAAESTGREVEVDLQFFDIRETDEAGRWVDWAPLADPLTLFVGTMGPLSVSYSTGSDSEPASSIITVRAVSKLLNRGRPPYAFYSHQDQWARSPGDNFFVATAEMASSDVRWPVF